MLCIALKKIVVSCPSNHYCVLIIAVSLLHRCSVVDDNDFIAGFVVVRCDEKTCLTLVPLTLRIKVSWSLLALQLSL